MTAPEKPDLILEKALSVISHSAGAQPVVTLSWARSTAGAIAAADGVPVKLSGPESLALTHRLRAAHDIMRERVHAEGELEVGARWPRILRNR